MKPINLNKEELRKAAWRVYNRIWMREYRKRKREQRLLGRGQCPECKMVLKPEYESYHLDCPYFKSHIHAKSAFYMWIVSIDK